MKDACATADEGTTHIVSYLQSIKETLNVINVENDKEYQKRDIDLIWTYTEGSKTVEIKVDNYASTGNYFFETISNVGKNTKGCFMYSEADLLFYYFLKIRELHVMPLKQVREWFIKNQGRFRTVRTSTAVNGNKYYTEGALVKRATVEQESKVTIIKI